MRFSFKNIWVLSLLVLMGCRAYMDSNQLSMEHGLESDRYDYLWHAATAILLSREYTNSNAKLSDELLMEARSSYKKWKQMSLKPLPKANMQLRKDIWGKYIIGYRAMINSHPDHPYYVDLQTASKSLEKILSSRNRRSQ